MKTISVLCSALVLAACGAAYEDEPLAEEREAYSARFACFDPTCATFGTRTGSSALRCDRQASGQVCALPPGKVVRWLVAPGKAITPELDLETVRSAARTALTDVIAGAPRLSQIETRTDPNLIFIVYGPQATPQCAGGSKSNNIDSYVCLGGDLEPSLTESLPGQYAIRPLTFVYVDLQEIRQRGIVTPTGGANLAQNAIRNAVIKALGAGGVNADDARCSARTISAVKLDQICVFTPGELCRINSFLENGSKTTFTETPFICGE